MRAQLRDGHGIGTAAGEPGVRPRVAGLVLAAGASRRFGAAGPKQLALLEGRPLLEHALAAMAGASGVSPVLVTLGAHAEEILAQVDLHGATPLLVAGWEEGQAASLRAGVAALAPHADAIVVTLGDQPRVEADAIARIARYAVGGAGELRRARGPAVGATGRSSGGRDAAPAGATGRSGDVPDAADLAAEMPLAVRATFGGVPGHPVLLRAPLFPAVAHLHGDAGARDLLDPATTLTVEYGAGTVLDVDTPAALRRA